MGVPKNKVHNGDNAIDMEAGGTENPRRSQLCKRSLCGSFCGQETFINVNIHYKNIFASFLAHVNTINSLA